MPKILISNSIVINIEIRRNAVNIGRGNAFVLPNPVTIFPKWKIGNGINRLGMSHLRSGNVIKFTCLPTYSTMIAAANWPMEITRNDGKCHDVSTVLLTTVKKNEATPQNIALPIFFHKSEFLGKLLLKSNFSSSDEHKSSSVLTLLYVTFDFIPEIIFFSFSFFIKLFNRSFGLNITWRLIIIWIHLVLIIIRDLIQSRDTSFIKTTHVPKQTHLFFKLFILRHVQSTFETSFSLRVWI